MSFDVDIFSSMFSSLETSPIANVGVFEQSLTVYIRFGNRLYLHLTPTEAMDVSRSLRARPTSYERTSLTNALGGFVIVRWNGERTMFMIGGAAIALFDETETDAFAAALQTCATRAIDLIEGNT